MGKRVYAAVLQPLAEGGYFVTIPDLDIATQGETLAEAIEMARDAIGMWGICKQDLGGNIPEAKTISPPHNENEIVALIDIDFEAFRKSQDIRAERTNVTVPAYLLNEARNRKINVSAVLQEALKDRLQL